jgi:SAM-dependent methyltransferase
MPIIKKFIVFLVSHDVSWFFLKPFSRLGSMMLRVRNSIEQSRSVLEQERFHEDLYDNIFHERKVLHGPFKGLQYPAYNSIGSALYPKLLGSYERELHDVLKKIMEDEFSEIVNIGCGEGYYAIGLARIFPRAKIVACDTDPHALKLCRDMAELNQVRNQISYVSEFTESQLKVFEFSGKGLIVCDCEGYEKVLFTSSNIKNLVNCHLLIEIHDFIDIHISAVLSDLFSASHNLTIVKSLDDIEKAKLYRYDELKNIDLPAKKRLLGEGRPAIMEWFFFVPKQQTRLD